MSKFKLGDTVRVISRNDYHWDHVGRITSIRKSDKFKYPFHVSGLHPNTPLWYGPNELILADPHHEMINDPEGQQLVQAIHERKEKP